MRNKPMYVNQRSGLDSPGKGHLDFQHGRPNHGLKITRRLVIVSFILSFLMAASLVVMIVMYFRKVIYLNDIEHEAKELVNSINRGYPVSVSAMDPSGYQIMQSLARIGSSFQTLQAKEERLRRTCEIGGDITTCNNKPTEGWKLNGPYLYYFSTETKNWFDARKYCTDHNSDLVSITSEEEQLYLASMRGQNKYWIGLTNEKPGGHWYYVDGSAYKEPFFWALNQPDNWMTPEGQTEHCAEMVSGGRWYDILCTIHSKWICKKQCLKK
ncbi:CD209 antigen-like protein C isoform X1 [Lissotriton helveticus]